MLRYGAIGLASLILAITLFGGDTTPAIEEERPVPVIREVAEAEEHEEEDETLVAITYGSSTIEIPAGTTDEQQDRVRDALALFAAHDLDLPDLVIRFFVDEAECDEHMGIFWSSTSPWSIHVCSELEFVLTHELAHAFLDLHLDEADRAAYTADHDLPTWNNKSTEWQQRAVEHAAFAIQQNLMVPPPPGPLSKEWDRRATAYEMLTGKPSPLRPEPSESRGLADQGR